MKTLPKTIAGTESKRHRLQLANWLREWQIDCSIRPSQPVDKVTPTEPAIETSVFCDFLPTAGQIVLLPPAPAPRAYERPIYVLVLKKVHDACPQQPRVAGAYDWRKTQAFSTNHQFLPHPPAPYQTGGRAGESAGDKSHNDNFSAKI